MNFKEWPEEWIASILSDFPIFSRETKLFLAKSMALISDAIEAERKR